MAQQNTAYDEKVRQELECSICLDQYQKPKLLGCMHTFCEPCITRLIKNGTISCPQCRQVSKVPNGVSGLSTNYIAQNIIEKLKTSARGNQPCCHDCANGIPATNHCKNCVLNLCKDCTNYHQRCVRFVGHCIVAVSTVSQESVNQVRYCAKHKELLKYFCENCKVVVCNDCMISNQHKQHSISLLAEATTKAKNVLTKKLKKADLFCNDLLNHMYDGRDFQEKIIEADKKSVQLIKQAFKEIRENIARREEQLIAEINKQTNMQSLEKFTASVKKINDSIVYINKVIDSNKNDEKMEVIMDLTNQLDALEKEFDFNQKYYSNHQNGPPGNWNSGMAQTTPLLTKPREEKFICAVNPNKPINPNKQDNPSIEDQINWYKSGRSKPPVVQQTFGPGYFGYNPFSNFGNQSLNVAPSPYNIPRPRQANTYHQQDLFLPQQINDITLQPTIEQKELSFSMTLNHREMSPGCLQMITNKINEFTI